ncbi:LysR substrate-binding domain-containing protein [Xanthobacter autotrophicus]|uniref:LysR family transcriptional regulator n=1 Tax=Xanthobacter autotrophicus TaxID=280 RepID=UPI0037278F52
MKSEVHMEIRQFRCFVAVAEQLHFSRAAEQLGMAAPSMTKQIQDMERALGVRLFHRTKRSVQLTAAGSLFLDDARRVLEQAERAQDTARRAGRGELGRIVIGYVASTGYAGVLQEQVAAFRCTHPSIDLEFREVAMDLLPEMLDDGRIDIAFLRPPMAYPPGIVAVPLLRDPFVVALPERHPLGTRAVIEPRDLAGEIFVLPEQDAGTWEVARRGAFDPKLGPRPGSLAAVVILVSLGAGIAIVPGSLSRAVSVEHVVYRQLSTSPILSEIAAAFRRTEWAPATKAFIAQIRAAVRCPGEETPAMPRR